MTAPAWLLYYENPVGRIWEHPDGYVVLQYREGERQLAHLQAFLTHVGRLLQQRGWNRILADQRPMAPYTPEESAWIVEYWLDQNQQRPQTVYGAVLLTPAAYAQVPADQRPVDAQVASLIYHLFDDEAAAVGWLQHIG